jgi:hypothetical protein
MGSFAFQKDMGEYISVLALNGGSFTSTTDGSEVSSPWVSRTTAMSHPHQSGKLLLWAHSTLLAAGETITLAANLQDATSSTGAGAADHGSSTGSLVIGSTASTAAQTVRGCLEVDVDLTEANAYIRGQSTVTLSAASGDGVQYMLGMVLAGAGTLPAETITFTGAS